MKVEHILVSLLFVFLLYHFTCKCRVEGMVKNENKCYGNGWKGSRDYYTSDNTLKYRDYCIYQEGDTIPGSCDVIQREISHNNIRYNDIWCRDGLTKADKDEDKIKWGKCGDENEKDYTWVYDPQDAQKLKCIKCDGECMPSDMRNSPLNTVLG